ncbi:MAG: TRAP transporter small permease [Bacteroidales bacterium]|nr:TRAP transporter small permease [Bacteroidales bacterium]
MNFNQKLNKILEYVLVAIMSILVIDVLWQVISRYILSSPSSFTDELAGFLLIWVGMLGAAYVAGRNEHLAIDIVLQRSTGLKKKRLQILINVIIFMFAFTVMFIGGTWLVYTRFILEVKSAALQLPLGFVYMVMPISGLLIVYYSVFNLNLIYKSDK